jgi:hypothetical protein
MDDAHEHKIPWGEKTFKVHGSNIRPINSPKDPDNSFFLEMFSNGRLY